MTKTIFIQAWLQSNYSSEIHGEWSICSNKFRFRICGGFLSRSKAQNTSWQKFKITWTREII